MSKVPGPSNQSQNLLKKLILSSGGMLEYLDG